MGDQLAFVSPTESSPAHHHVRLATRSATALDWHGLTLSGVRLFNEQVSVIVEIDEQEHERRVAAGWAPVLDRPTVAMWSWPENAGRVPGPVTRVIGVLLTDGRWQQAIPRAAGFNGFGSTAVVTRTARRPSDNCLLTAQLRGVGVVWHPQSDVFEVVSPARVGPVATARPTNIARWVQEALYDHLLKSDILAQNG